MVTSVMKTCGVTKSYGPSTILRDFDLTIDHGIVGLLGPNGAGKTTLLDILATVTRPDVGSVMVMDVPTDNVDGLRAARRVTGYLPQRFAGHGDFTVAEFIAYVAWLRRLPRQGRPGMVDEAIARVGLSDRSGTKLKRLSGGMRQRVGVAQAIVGDPPIVILDEPTVGLDPRQRLDLRSMLRSISSGTIVLSTHLVEDVAALCDRVHVMANGSIVFSGTTGDLIDAAGPDAPGDSPIERGYTTVTEAVAR